MDHINCDDIHQYLLFVYNSVTQKIRFYSFYLVCGRDVITRLDTMILHEECANVTTEAGENAERGEATRQIAGPCIQYQQAYNAYLHNVRYRQVTQWPDEDVWCGYPVRHIGHY